MDIEKMVDGLTRLYWEVSKKCHFCHITMEFPGPCNTMYNFSCQYRAYLGPYWSMLGHTAPYGAKLDRTRPYENLWVYRGPIANNFGSIQNHTKTYKTILDHTDPYRAILGNKRPYRAISGHTGPCQAIPNHIRTIFWFPWWSIFHPKLIWSAESRLHRTPPLTPENSPLCNRTVVH